MPCLRKAQGQNGTDRGYLLFSLLALRAADVYRRAALGAWGRRYHPPWPRLISGGLGCDLCPL